jgi:hypothetical protein
MLKSQIDRAGQLLAFISDVSFETIVRYSPIAFDDDFVGSGHTAVPTTATAGYPWIKKLVKTGGTPAVSAVANLGGGVMSALIDATSEKQEATLYYGDQLQFDVSKGVVFEARVAFHTIPTGVAEIVFGLQSAWADGPDTATYYLDFQASASGAINCRSKDGVNTTSDASSVTLVADAYHVFQIDASDPTNVLFFIDGTRVGLAPPATRSFAATGASAILQPYMSVYKASGTGVGEVRADYLSAYQVSRT